METTFANLLAVPSFHYDPRFAARAREAIERFEPAVIALELPAELADELAWALGCWPVPVASESRGVFTPFVPGDSMFEAYRLARARGIAVELVDASAAPIARAPRVFPGPECARIGAPYLDVVAALDALHPVTAEDAAREATMAARLSGLMRAHPRVLWVGGVAHWPRIRALLASGCDDPVTAPPSRAHFRRARLSPSVLERACGRWPYLVERYARDPAGYDEEDAHRSLALEAGAAAEGVQGAEGTSAPPHDVGRVLLYARNLAMSRGLGDRPRLADLLHAASAVVDDGYAERLYELAMRETTSPATAHLPSLEYRVTFALGDQEGLRPRALLPEHPRPRAPVAHAYRAVPTGQAGAPTRWLCYPPDEEAYESFVRAMLLRATARGREAGPSAPFVAGMRDGLDARATARHWHDERLFVREAQPRTVTITNGLVDFEGDREDDERPGGWADPSLLHVGSASRHRRSEVLQEEPCHVQRMHRELSLITLDAPTSARAPGARNFYDSVIHPLVTARSGALHDWLEVMFDFCAGKPFAYFSRYTPSPRLHRLAAARGVRVVHHPLQDVPATLLQRNRSFRFLAVTRAQWEQLTLLRGGAAVPLGV